MRFLTTLLFMAISAAALAGGKPLPPVATATQQQAQEQSQQQQQQQRQDQANVQTATGGAGGMVTIESGALEGGDNSIELNSSFDSDYKRNAPAVTVMPSPTTAEMMVCFGVGGSGIDGAATGAWCRLQKELYAEHMATMFANMRLYEDAAKTYCARKLHWKPFGTEGYCIDRMVVGYRVQFPPIVKITGPPIPVKPDQCEEKLKRCEDVTK